MTSPPSYPITYTPAFAVFWGLALGTSLYIGGLLTFALSALLLLMLVTHEHAHVVACQKCGVRIESITFTWLGGQVDCDVEKHNDDVAFKVYTYGVIDTTCYAVAFVFLLIVLTWFGMETGWNFADPYGTLQRMQFARSAVLLSGLFAVTNILPVAVMTQKHGEISTDGWAAFRIWWKNR